MLNSGYEIPNNGLGTYSLHGDEMKNPAQSIQACLDRLNIGYVEELTEFLTQMDTVSALVQNEIHPYYQENDIIPFIQDLGIVVQGWYPLGDPGSSNPEHIKENNELYHFNLTEDEMAKINALDRGEKHDWY